MQVSDRWEQGDAYERYVDERGAVLIRFVNRSQPGQFGEDQRFFSFSVRMEGSIE